MMSVLDLGRLSGADAESVVAILWRVLEEYDIASPRIEVVSYGSGLVALRLTFDETEAAERVQGALRRLMPDIEVAIVPQLVEARRVRSGR